MPIFDESCVLIPCSTLEDFPQGGSHAEGRNLLAAWSVLWHPAVIVACGGCPAWYRADAAPLREGRRLVAVPESAAEMVPADQMLGLIDPATAFQADQTASCKVAGPDRAAMLAGLGFAADGSPTDDPAARAFWGDFPGSLRFGSHGSAQRTISPPDFFALAYTSLQIQIMTRRLRYSSNLDEMALRRHVKNAAEHFVGGAAGDAIDAMHEAFDLISEERDHYFASDPSLIDLILLTPGTLPRLSPRQFCFPSRIRNDADEAKESAAIPAEHAIGPDNSVQGESVPPRSITDKNVVVLSTIGNVLLDGPTLSAMADDDSAGPDSPSVWLREAIARRDIGWAGGGPVATRGRDGDAETSRPAGAAPTDELHFDELTFAQCERALRAARDHAADVIGQTPTVYARPRGATPSDLTPTLSRLGYRGVIPMDFARGTGHGDEAKVVLQTGGVELDALTAKPIDASGDASFLNLLAKLGESIDSGEIATALLVHWPGETCESFDDLRRAASWSLALGKFWHLEDYFVDGEHPYHHASPYSLSSGTADALTQRSGEGLSNPISALARQTRDAVAEEAAGRMVGLIALAGGDLPADDATGTYSGATSGLAATLGFDVDAPKTDAFGSNEVAASVLVVNPHSAGDRRNLHLIRPASKKLKHVYGASVESSFAAVTVDTPGLGFSVTTGDGDFKGGGLLSGDGWLGRTFRGDRRVARGDVLVNQFLEARILESTGGIGSVFSGATRGNRFSMRLVHVATGESAGAAKSSASEMIGDTLQVIRNGRDEATIRATGRLVRDDQDLAEFQLNYSLRRGSRTLSVAGILRPGVPLGGDPWNNYIAARVATATEAAIDRVIVRDKLHRSGRRRMVAPLGLLIDETERRTLIASHGYAYHRRAGDRFVDTLLTCPGETETAFHLDYVFDPKSAVAMAKSLIVPPSALSLGHAGDPPISRQGWLIHRSPATIDVTELRVFRRGDGHLAGVVRLVQTSSESTKVSLRFCRDVRQACRVEDDPAILEAAVDDLPKTIPCTGDKVKLSLIGHAVVDLLVIFTKADGGEGTKT